MMPSPKTLVEGAFVAVHGAHHRLDGRIEDAPCILRVSVPWISSIAQASDGDAAMLGQT
jgi:hypothetical protein